MKTGIIIQARTGSTRLPNKINADIGGWSMLKHVRIRCEKTPGIDQVIVAMADEYPDLDENDVLGRYYLCAQQHGLDVILRVTSDCPFIDPMTNGVVLHRFLHGYDYCANDLVKSYPDGMGVEVFSFRVLQWAHRVSVTPEDREHVSPMIIRRLWGQYGKGKIWEGSNVQCPIDDYSNLKLSVDTQEDLDRVRAVDLAKPVDYSLAATIAACERVGIV